MLSFPKNKPPHLVRWGFSFCVIWTALFLASCGTSTPRFAGEENSKSKKTAPKKKSDIRFSSKEAEEEKKEDDHKVDVDKAATRFSTKKNVKTHEPGKADAAPSGSPESFTDQKMMDEILQWIGTPYEYGGETKSGIDCSAFTKTIFQKTAGLDLPRTTEEQVQRGKSIQRNDLKFGDLLFFNTTGQNPSHVGIYIGDDMFAHASVSGGVTLSSLYSSYYKKRYTEARRVLQ
jgi:cell wall-associated NlpC family hydrolase